MPAPSRNGIPPKAAPGPESASAEGGRSTTRRFGSNALSEIDLKPEGAGSAIADPKTGGGGKPYLPGDVIQGKYRLTRIIGRGGMGAVWLAHNVPLDIEVAIKLIRRDRTAAGAADRLLTEARAAARLMHPAIVRVFDFGETEQHDPFIVMELLRGESLNAILRRKRRLTPTVAVQMMLPVAAALASAHSKGIVHRDLKPDNIIVITDETGALVPKIVDFGIAKLTSPGIDHHVTMAGEVLGSPDYMSPEQARGASNVGEGSDIWTFTVVLYELITGKRPFDGANYNALIASIITSDPPPIMSFGVGDAALSGILEHGLAKDAGGRWATIREMASALASWAVANGIEEDVMGSPIAKQWLSNATRRILTVQPETGEAPQRSGLITPVGVSSGSTDPQGNHAVARSATVQRSAALVEGRRASARNAIVLVLGILMLGAAAVTLFVARLSSSIEPPRSPAQGTTASASVTSSPTTTAAPPDVPPSSTTATTAGVAGVNGATSVAADAAAPVDSASAASAASAHPILPHYPRRPRAPPAPKHIQF